MKKFLEGLWKFLNSKVFGYVVVALLIVFLAGQCKRNVDHQNEDIKQEQNISALGDTIKIERQKNGELLTSIDGYISLSQKNFMMVLR